MVDNKYSFLLTFFGITGKRNISKLSSICNTDDENSDDGKAALDKSNLYKIDI